jgi:hypothetical protein
MSFIGELLTTLGLAAAPNPAKPRQLPSVPGAWLGADRGYIPGATPPKLPARAADLDWTRLLPAHSNLRFLGAYLEGGTTTYPDGWSDPGVPVNPATKSPFTFSSTNVRRGWIPNVTQLRAQGWGTVFIYFGYSVDGRESISKTNATTAQYAKLGTLDAQHAKLIMNMISPALDGAVVYFDNEDVATPVVTATFPIMSYYQAFFAELQRPGPTTGIPAMRAGVYTYWKDAPAFVGVQPDLFWWQDGEKLDISTSPGGLDIDPMHLDPSLPGRGMAAIAAAAGRPYLRAVANQFFEYTGVMPEPGSPAAAALVTATAPDGYYDDWDFNTSFVRDPAYPVAEPRFGCGNGNPAAPLVAEGFYLPPPPASGGAPPQMAVDAVTLTSRSSVTLPTGWCLEPEAPICAASAPGGTASSTTNYFASLAIPTDTSGSVVNADFAVFDDSGAEYAWTVTGMAVAPRRLRTLALAAGAADELDLFYAGYDPTDAGQFLLCGMRRTGGTWTGPDPLGPAPGLGVHPFAGLAAAVLAGTSVNAFTISWLNQAAGVLTQVSWPLGTPSPPATVLELEASSPSAFLPGTRLAAVSTDPSTVVVFGVGTDLQLRSVAVPASAAAASDVTITVLSTGSGTDFVLPQTALAAAVAPPGIVVAAFSDTGPIRLYQLDTSATPWSVSTAPLPDPPQVPAPAPGGSDLTVIANQWRPNPFGDLGFGQQGDTQYLYAAGVNPSAANTTALLQYALPTGPWEVYQR